MKLTINGQSIAVELENTALGESLRAIRPVTLDMARSGEHAGGKLRVTLE